MLSRCLLGAGQQRRRWERCRTALAMKEDIPDGQDSTGPFAHHWAWASRQVGCRSFNLRPGKKGGRKRPTLLPSLLIFIPSFLRSLIHPFTHSLTRPSSPSVLPLPHVCDRWSPSLVPLLPRSRSFIAPDNFYFAPAGTEKMSSILSPSCPSSSTLSFVLAFILLLQTILLRTADASFLDQCTVGVSALLTDRGVNACLPLGPLMSIVVDDITPKLVNDTTTSFCKLPNCSPATVTLIENTINQNCVNTSDDYTSMQAVYGAASLYVPLKQGLCQRIDPPKNGTFCLTVFTESLQQYIKKHPQIKNWDVFLNQTLFGDYVASMPNSMLCTDCNKAMITPVISFVSIRQLNLDANVVAWVRGIQFMIQKRCGATFVNGVAPIPSSAPTPSNPVSPNQSQSGPGARLLMMGSRWLWILSTTVAFFAHVFRS